MGVVKNAGWIPLDVLTMQQFGGRDGPERERKIGCPARAFWVVGSIVCWNWWQPGWIPGPAIMLGAREEEEDAPFAPMMKGGWMAPDGIPIGN